MENNIINNDKKLEELVGMLVEKKIEELAEKKLNQNETPKEMPCWQFDLWFLCLS